MPFKLNDNITKNISKVTEKASTLEAKQEFNLKNIDIECILPNPKNFYGVREVEELAKDIKINGLYSNLLVEKIEENKYRLISGERRYRALSLLVEQGNDNFRKVPCQVRENIDEVDSEIMLIQANASTRELTENEKLHQVKRLEELYKIKRKSGELRGDTKEKIGNDLGMSRTQVSRYQKINKSLIEPLKELIEKEKLSIANASLFATLPEENQIEIYKLLKHNVDISKAAAEEMVKKIKSENLKVKEQLDSANLENKDIKDINKKLELKVNEYEKQIEQHKQNEANIEKEIEEKLKNEFTQGNQEEIKKLKEKLKKEKDKVNKLNEKIQESPINVHNIENIKINTEIELGLKDLINKVKVLKEKTNGIDEIVPTDENKKLYKEYETLSKEIQDKLNSILLK